MNGQRDTERKLQKERKKSLEKVYFLSVSLEPSN